MGFLRKQLFGSLIVFVLLCGTSVTSAWTFWVAPPTSANCVSPVPFADTENCTCYYQCFRVGALWELVHLNCPSGGIWDDVYKACVEGECGQPTSSPPPIMSSSSTTTTTTTTKTTQRTTKPSITAPPSSTKPTPIAPTTTTTRRTTTKPPVVTPPRPPPSNGPCPRPGFFPHPDHCQAYYRCIIFRGRYYMYPFLCPFGAYFSDFYNRCVIGTCPAPFKRQG